jgi:hypothetical protein
MTRDELLNKWGSSFSFTATAQRDPQTYQIDYNVGGAELREIDRFTKDFEKYFKATINANIIANLTNGNLSPLKFKALVKEPIEYQISSEFKDILSDFSPSGSFSTNNKIHQLLGDEDLWKEYASVERDFEIIDGNNKEIKIISIDIKDVLNIGFNNLRFNYNYNNTSGLYDYVVVLQTQILTNLIKKYLEDLPIMAFGVLNKKGETTIETIETPEIGNWKTEIGEDGTSTFIEIEKDEIIQELKDSMDPQVGKEYHSYSIQEVGNDIRVETTPFDKEPFDVKIEDIKLEE